MDLRRSAWVGLELVVLGVVVALIAGQVLGSPVLFGYVETGSMAPTLNPGDGFVAIPAAVAGPPAVGDVVTYRAEQLHGGGLVTHRIVGRTEHGFVTRGDANPFTDQDGQEPPVKRAQIVAKAWQVGGGVVAIPHLGTAVMGLQSAFATVQRRAAIATGMRSFVGSQGLAYLLLVLSGALYVVDLLLDDGASRDRTRGADREAGIDSRLVVAGLALILVLSATAAMTVPGGTQSYGIVSAEFASQNPTVIRAGEASTVEYRVPNAGLVPVQVYLEPASDGVAIAPHHLTVGSRETRTASLTLRAPPSTGYYRRFLTERRYLAVLPGPVIDGLYRIHPWAPIVAIDALLAGGMGLLGRWLLGGRRVKLRRRQSRHDRSLLDRIKRLITGD